MSQNRDRVFRGLFAVLGVLLAAGLVVFMVTVGWDWILGTKPEGDRGSISLNDILERMPNDIRSPLKQPSPTRKAMERASDWLEKQCKGKQVTLPTWFLTVHLYKKGKNQYEVWFCPAGYQLNTADGSSWHIRMYPNQRFDTAGSFVLHKATGEQADWFEQMEVGMDKMGWKANLDPAKRVRVAGTVQSISVDHGNNIDVILSEWRVESDK